MLSGSLALNHYVKPRMTMDLDIVIELTHENKEKFTGIFDDNYYINKAVVHEEIARKGMFNVIDFETGFKIDFIVRKNNKYREIEFSRKKKVDLGEFHAWMVSPEDLIISKIIWIQKLESEKQMNDIKMLLGLKYLDFEYIRNWIQKLSLNTYNLV